MLLFACVHPPCLFAYRALTRKSRSHNQKLTNNIRETDSDSLQMSEQNPEEQENTQLLEPESRNERGNRMGYGSIAIKFWEISSHSAFILGLMGRVCYSSW